MQSGLLKQLPSQLSISYDRDSLLHTVFQNKSTHYLLFLNHRTLDVVQLLSLYTVFKDTAACLVYCRNPSYQSNPLSDGSVILPLLLARFHMHSSYAELISALKPCQLLLSSALYNACKLQAHTPPNNLAFPLSWKRRTIIPQKTLAQLQSHLVFYLLCCFTFRLLLLLLHFFGGGCGSCLLVCDTFRSRHVGLLFAIPVKVLLG